MSQKRLFTSAPREPEPLTFLSNGGGQDSTALLLRLINEPEFRRRYAPGRLISITADTGNEHRPTLYNLVRMRRLCREHGIEFFFVTARYGHHVGDWQSLQHFYESGSRIGSKSYPKSCSSSLKIQPLYKFLCAYLSEHYGVSSNKKDGLYEYTALTGEPITALIGISAEETSRRLDPSKKAPPWLVKNILRSYPLVDDGWTRKDCRSYIEALEFPLPPASLCLFCPYKSKEHVLLTSLENPPAFKTWVRLERAKLDAHAERFPHLPEEKNHGVFGPNTTLPQIVRKTRAKYPTISDDELREKLSRDLLQNGHKVGSKY